MSNHQNIYIYIFNLVYLNWMIFDTSVALHVCKKIAKPFGPVQNGLGDMPY